jgi:hypothetical protein
MIQGLEKVAKDLIIRYKMEKLELSKDNGLVNKDHTREEEEEEKKRDENGGEQSNDDDGDPECLGKVLYETPGDAEISNWTIEDMYGMADGSSTHEV